MRGSRYLGFVAAAATLLAAAPLSAIFDQWTWLIQAVIAVGAGYGAATVARTLRFPVWGQFAASCFALLIALTWIFPSGREWLALIPTLDTLSHFRSLLTASAEDMRTQAIPVGDTDPLLFVTVLGVGAVAAVVDLLAVGLRRPALAGLPMLAIYSVPVAVYADSVPALPFVIGATGFLWLLVSDNVDRVRRFGRRFTGDGRDVDVWEPSPLSAAGRRLAAVGVVLAVLLPLAVPGMTSGLLSNLTAGNGEGDGTGRGGAPGRISLFAALSGQLTQAETRDLVTLTTTEEDPFYLRIGVLDEVRSDGFRDHQPGGESIGEGLPPVEKAGRGGVSRQTYRAQVETTRDLNMQLLPIYADPVTLQGLDRSWAYDPNLEVLHSRRNQARNKTYTFDYVRSTYTPQALAAAPPLADNDPAAQYTRVPPVPQVTDMVNRLTNGKQSSYARVRALYDSFSQENGFLYSLSTEGGTSGSEILDFLRNKRGYCQQYAAALAWLVRAAGIPARVAVGFTRGVEREKDKFVLTNQNLHAWTEVYFTGIGWVPFDATPAASVPGSARFSWAPDTDRPDEPLPSAAPTDPTDGVDDIVPGDNREEIDPESGLPVTEAVPQAEAATWPWWAAAGVLALFAMLAMPAVRRVLLRRRRARRVATAAPVVLAGSPGAPDRPQVRVEAVDADRVRSDAHAAWDELLDTMVDFRMPVDPAETPRLTADRLATAGVDVAAADAARLLGRAEERARYARDPVHEGNLGPALRAVRRGLAAGVSRRRRVAAAVLPPSVLLRWRTAVMDDYARAVAGFGRLRTGLLRFSPRRLIARRTAIR